MTTKIKLTAIIGIVLSLLLSCTTERTEISALTPKEGELVKIIAYADGAPQTKTGLVDKEGGGKSVVWKSGNAISLFFNGGSNGGNKFTTTSDGPIAEFTGSISAVSGSLSGVGGIAYFWGLYPYKSTASCDGQSITTSLPSNQKAYQGDVADNLLVTVGRSENLSIHFKNACSVIGFTVSQENIRKIVFSGNAEEPVAGEFNISFDENENLVDAPTSNAVDQIIITPAETTTFEPGVTYYFAILPNQFSAGYSLTFTKDDESEAIFIRETSCAFNASTFYTMTEKDAGLIFSPVFPSDYTIVFADDSFKSYCVKNFDTNRDGEISVAEAKQVTSIDVTKYGLTSLQGIEFFTQLSYLTCDYNKLKNLDVSNNYKLQSLHCDNNQLTSLDVSNNPELETLICHYNQLTSLDVSNNTKLQSLSCPNNQLTSLILGNASSLTSLSCPNNQLTSLDVSNAPLLSRLWCGNNLLTSLDVSNNIALTDLDCDYNPYLLYIYLKTGQYIKSFSYNHQVAHIIYVD